MADSKRTGGAGARPKRAGRKKGGTSAKAGGPRSAATTAPGPSPVRSAEFRERLGSLENMLDEELRAAGASVEVEDDGPVVRAAEGVLDVYARLGRTLEDASVARALAGLSERIGGDPNDFGFDPDFERALLPLLRFLYRSWWRVELAGVEKIPAEGPVVLVGNHSGNLFAYDGAMLRRAVADHHSAERWVRPLLDASVCDVPVLGDVMARCGGVVDTEENAEILLDRGEVIAVFPEGAASFHRAYGSRYEVGPFVDDGFVRVALRAGAPIVPVAVVGAEETHPALGRVEWLAKRVGLPSLPLTPTFPWLGVGGLLPLPSRWRIEFGTPLRGLPDRAAGIDDEALVRRVSARARGRVQALVERAVGRRGRAFF